MAAEITDFRQLMELEPHGTDAHVGVSPSYPWGRVYGGQVVAQAYVAAAKTVEPEYRIHSLHAYFIRGGDSDEPIRYEVDRIRNGRSFVTRRVVARQSNGAILNLSASFHIEEDEPETSTVEIAPGTPRFDTLPDDTDMWTTLMERRFVSGEVGNAGAAGGENPPSSEPDFRAAAWTRLVGDLGDDPVMHAAGLAYVSDDYPTEAVRETHPLWQEKMRDGSGEHDNLFNGASLDHSIWFHRPQDVTDWQLHDYRGSGMVGGRGLAIGNVFASDGTHVATVAQEALLRVARPR